MKIAPEYAATVVHVNDASRAVTVASNLLNKETKTAFSSALREEYDTLRDGYLNRAREKNFLTIEQARQNKFKIDWDNYQPIQPNFIGTKIVEVELSELVNFIDWTPFFQSWELFGKYPAILTDEVVGEQATDLFKDAQIMLAQIVFEKWFTAKGILGIYPANTVNDDDIEVQLPTSNFQLLTLRQQSKKTVGAPNIALADFIAPKETNKQDYMGCFCVTTGFGVDEKALEGKDIDLNDKDALFEDAARLIVSSQSGSTSLLQRRMKLGYNRAGRLMDQLEAAGIVGPNQGSKVRDVLIKTEAELQMYFDN